MLKTNKGYLLFLIYSVLYSCGGGNKEQERNVTEQDTTTEERSGDQEKQLDTAGWQSHRDSIYHFGLKYPEGWKVLGPQEPFRIINIYSTEHENEFELPLKIHNKPIVSHVTLFPEGFGTELPSGKVITLEEWDGHIFTEFEVDKSKSMVFLTEGGDPWGYLLRTLSPPPGWDEQGFIFVQIKSTDVSFTCIDEVSGERKPMDECDPMTGDTVKRSGNVSPGDEKAVMQIIESLYFFGDRVNRRPLQDLIRIEKPQPNERITSPLEISGMARGYWYFEGDFPVELVDINGKVLGTGIAAAGSEWMTEDFVPFEVTIEYKQTSKERGYIIFKRSNASGLPEHDRTYRLPVKFN